MEFDAFKPVSFIIYLGILIKLQNGTIQLSVENISKDYIKNPIFNYIKNSGKAVSILWEKFAKFVRKTYTGRFPKLAI